MLFSLHISAMILTLLNFIDNCIEATLGILYSALFMIIFNPIILFLFYRCKFFSWFLAYAGLLKDKSKLTLYFWIQPIIIVLEITISIVDFLGFNGFIMVADLFNNGQAIAGILSLVVSIGFVIMALFSAYLYYRCWKEKSLLTKALLWFLCACLFSLLLDWWNTHS